ncbi:MAG: nucleotidyltransferase domain-containing protein [Planctomycetaceae bacterium]|nr:nucleotidyltransferase domain-containing protein [Planctomycetaceae bacterium]
MLTTEEIKRRSIPLAQQYGIAKLALFGSYAAGQATDASDADFLIEKGDMTDLLQFYGFVNALEDELGIPVDVLTYQSIQDSLLNQSPLQEVILYERT